MIQIKALIDSAVEGINALGVVKSDNAWLQQLAEQSFQEELQRQLAAADYSAKALLEIFVQQTKSTYSASNWLDAIYQFTLSLTYPSNAAIPDYPNVTANSYVFLELYRLICQLEKSRAKGSFVYDYPFELLSTEEIEQLEDAGEYQIVLAAFRYDYIYELMKLSSELFPYTTLEHITGVHYLAMFIARQVKAAGIPVDLGIVSGAAALHDIGKFGCRPEESHKVAYYHYYYTEEWFYRKGIQYIRNIAVNHSTWDLELESLSIESLILIFSDFRVKQHDDPTERYAMKFFSLEQSFDVILAKLDNVDEAKTKRYQKVYNKLADFKAFLRSQGIATSFSEQPPRKEKSLDPALLRGDDIVKYYKNLSISHSLALMYELRNETALRSYLDDIKNTVELSPMRRKMSILAQFSKYLTPEQKIIVLDFLFDMLILHEEDLRRQAAEIMGQIIISFDDPYSKYLPPSVETDIYKLSKSKILRQFINRFLNPERSRSSQKNHWIGTALSDLFRIVLQDAKMPTHTIDLMLEQFSILHGKRRIYLLAALLHLPLYHLKKTHLAALSEALEKSLNSGDEGEVLYAALCIRRLLPTADPKIVKLAESLLVCDSSQFHFNYLKYTISLQLDQAAEPQLLVLPEQFNALYLENLKSVTPQVVKLLNIEFLTDYMIKHDDAARFYFAVHLCNLIKNSEHYDIRLIAGDALLKLADHLSAEKLNEVVIELLRGLEIENYQFTKNIPPILGRLIVKLPLVEWREVNADLAVKIRRGSENLKLTVVETATHAIIAATAGGQNELLRNELIRIVFKGLVQSEEMCHIIAFNGLTIHILGTALLTLQQKHQLFARVAKKLLSVVHNIALSERPASVNYAYGYNKLYVFLSDYNQQNGPLNLPYLQKIAYFSGTFDPFNLGQKKVAADLVARGFEVYLAIDNFNWQRRTQPLELRRRLIEMTIADQAHVYTMPLLPALDLKFNDDCERLKALFADCQIYIVTGEDRVAQRRCYVQKDAAIRAFDHLLIKRTDDVETPDSAARQRILASLKSAEKIVIDDELSAINNDKIRYAIDLQWSIDDMVDQLAAEQIKKYNMYRNEPTYKSNVETISTATIAYDQLDEALLAEVKQALQIDLTDYLANIDVKRANILLIRESQNNAINSIGIYRELSQAEFDDIKDDQTIMTDHVELYRANTIVIDLLAASTAQPLHNHLLILHSEMIVEAINRGYDYSIYRPVIRQANQPVLRYLTAVGYRPIKGQDFLLASIKAPVVLLLDAQSMLKNEYRRDSDIRLAIAKSREKLLRAMVTRHSHSVILTFERSMVYNKINQIVEQQLAEAATEQTGQLMCVPFGDIYKRWLLPNVVTKALHTEREYDRRLRYFEVKNSPHYLPIEQQVAIVKAFRRSVLLIDDLVDKGLRLHALEPYFRDLAVPIRAVVVAILSGQGKTRAEKQGYRIIGGYYVPNMRAWYSESQLYPFIGGDAYNSGDDHPQDILPSVNKVLPYMYFSSDGINRRAAAHFSKTCLEQAMKVVATIERQYQHKKHRRLSIARLNEVFVMPRVPYYGEKMQLNPQSLPTDIIKNDFVRLEQIIALIER